MRWAWLLLVAGCFHVDLRLPPQPMTPDQRVTTYRRLAATEEETTTSNRGSSRTLILADGTKVRYVEDIVPVVPPDSTTARKARSATSHHRQMLWWLIGGFVTTMTGLFTWVSADENDDVQSVAGPALAAAGLVGFGVGLYHAYVYWDDEERAYENYNTDLAAELSVCASGLTVVPCEEVQQQPAAQPPAGNGGYYGTTPQPAPH